jgi:hypothetical protein
MGKVGKMGILRLKPSGHVDCQHPNAGNRQKRGPPVLRSTAFLQHYVAQT